MSVADRPRRPWTALALLGLIATRAATVAVAHDHTREHAQARADAARARDEAEASQAPRSLPADEACALTVELIDRGAPVAGLIRVTDLDDGRPLALVEGIARARNWYAVPRGATVRVPRARVRVEAFHGIETEVGAVELELSGRASATARLVLRRFADARARGLRSGNTHLHLMKLSRDEAERYLRDVPAADGLDLVFLSYLERAEADREYISNGFTRDDLGRLSRSGPTLFENGEEHRHNFGPGGEGFGHVMFLRLDQLIQPVSVGPGITKAGTDGPPLRRGILRARDRGAAVIWCHNAFGFEDIPSWVAGLLDAQNIFDGGRHGHYADTFYRYLDLGLKVPFSTGTDWGIYDFARVLVPVEGELTSRRWLDALAAGRSTITNGPLLEFSVEGKAPGETIALDAPRALRIEGRAVGRGDFRAVELVHNGEVVRRVEARRDGGHFAAELSDERLVDAPGWLALRVPIEAGSNELDQPLFAHTSALTVELAGRRRFRRDVAEPLRDEVRRSVEAIRERATFADDAERESVLDVYRDAIRLLDAWIERGHP